MEREEQDAESVVLSDLAVRDQGVEAACEERAAGAHDELADAVVVRRQGTAGVERGEALVVVAVAGEHDLGAAVVERLPRGCMNASLPSWPEL